MANIDLDKSNKMLETTLKVIMSVTLIFPILFYVYFNFGTDNYSKIDNYYKITTTTGEESGKRTIPSYKPITNLETTKEWLKTSMINLMTYDASNYYTEERYNMVKSILADEVLKSYWENDKARIETDIGNGYLRSAAIAAYKPVLLGESQNKNGEKMWKFFLEVQIKQENRYESYPRYYKKYAQVIVKEIDPTKSFKGIGIVKIDIK